MSLFNNSKGKKDKKDQKSSFGANQGSKFMAKPGKTANAGKKPHKTGGTRGS